MTLPILCFFPFAAAKSRRALLAAYYPSYARSLIKKPGYRCYGETVDRTADSPSSAELSCSTCSQCLPPPPSSWLRRAVAAVKREIQIAIETIAVVPVMGVKSALRLRLYSRGGKRLQRRFVAARESLLGPRDSAASPLWRVDMVATAPACRRRGLMKKLMAQLLEDADAANADIILGTTSKGNRAAYERKGFVVVEASRVRWGDWYVWNAPLTSGNAGKEEEEEEEEEEVRENSRATEAAQRP